ncbi:MAG: DUF736 domain-containing protein [Alphaproteobacteria bacterium HGW-Alphaproteobacteria-3]|nr:MAG: DUF736 domain-containing protein [Alphaproteobacteria bacterium HGW-Alphaproteobacteria-3]
MTIIGTFTKTDNGYTGEIKTLTIKAEVTLVPINSDKAGAPDFRVMAGDAELGAAWNRTSKKDKSFISLKLDDPSFAAPIYASLFEGEDDKFVLTWKR